VVVEDDGEAGRVGQVQKGVQPREEGGVERVLVARLGTRPDDAETQRVPTARAEVRNVSGCGGRESEASGASGLGGGVASKWTGRCRDGEMNSTVKGGAAGAGARRRALVVDHILAHVRA